MAEIKTKAEAKNPYEYIAELESEKRRTESAQIIEIFKEITAHEPVMWGPSIIGFDKYEYKYESGHGGVMCKVGFSPRKAALTFYLMLGCGEYSDLLAKLGKHTTGKGCLYIKKLEDIDQGVLKQICQRSYDLMNKKYC